MNPDANRAIDDEPCHCGTPLQHSPDEHSARRVPDAGYARKAAAVDRFITAHDIDPDDVISVSMDKPWLMDRPCDAQIHLRVEVPGLDYDKNHHPHWHAYTEQNDVKVRVVYVAREGVAA